MTTTAFARHPPSPRRQRWEYKVVTKMWARAEDELTELGQQGCEAVGTLGFSPQQTSVLLKRPLD
jgi:hypothetical protein